MAGRFLSLEWGVRFRFDDVEVRDQERQVLVGGVPAAVGARAFDVLLVLLRSADRVVTKGELLDAVWPGLAVEENNLQVQVSGLRRVLGTRAIATVPGRGYRFARPLRAEAPGAPVPAAAAAAETTAAAGPPRRGNLPAGLPPLIGRDAELAALRALLARHRTVALVAAAGVGKTHLARAVADGLQAAFADGVWWVELAELTSPALVAPEVARALGFQVVDGQPALHTVVEVLRGQQALLLLDNCEHVLPAVAALVAAVHDAAPQVRVLVTSQEPLKLAHEQVHRLDTLALPAGPGLAAAQRSGAVQLLVHRIQAAQPHFVATAANAPHLGAICARLDGIALALELAAARVPLLGLEGLHARLDERFQVLTDGSRVALPRHQTLRAALAFSHGLLGADAQAVFRRLGVFVGSFAAESAQDVAADAQIDRWAVLDHLGALADKSMLLVEPGDPPRLRLLETTRAWALERLAAAGETAAVQARHAHAVDRRLARAADEYWRLSDEAMLARYGPDHANVRAALDWALAHDGELAIRLAGNACGLWREALGLQPEGVRWCEAALAQVRETTPPRAHGRLLYTLAWMLIWSQQQRARAAAQRAAALLRRADDPATLGMTLLLLIPGTTALDAQQVAALDEMRRLHDPAAPPRVQAQLLSASARLAMGAQRYAEATALYAQARALLAGCGAAQWEGVLAWTMAGIALTTGDVDAALPTLQRTAQRLAELPSKGIFLAFALGSLATAHLLRGETAAARQALAQAAALIVRYGLGSRYAATAAWLAAQEGRWPVVAQLLGYGRAAGLASGVDAEEPVELVARRCAVQRLAAQASAEAIDHWMRAGAVLGAEAAYRLALADAPDALPAAA